MSDNLNKRGPADRQRISLSEPWEVQYWTRALGVSESKLREVIKEVGHMAADVRRHLAG
jgi:hypothetical protein